MITIDEWHKILKPNGWLIVSTCDPNGLRAKLYGSRWSEAQKPGHLMFFDEHLLGSMLKRVGFEEVRRLNWQIDYGQRSVFRRVINRLLQKIGLEGELRLFGRKSAV